MDSEELQRMLKTLISSNEEIKKEIKQNRETFTGEIRAFKEQFSGEIKKLRDENQSLKEELKELKGKVTRIERDSKKYSLVVYGLEEKSDEELIDVTGCLDLINAKLGIDCRFQDIRSFKRLGKPISGQSRPISIEVNSCYLKRDILNNAIKLKGTNVFISPEYTKEEYEERKILRKHLIEARKDNKEAYIRNKILTIQGEEYSVGDLKKLERSKSSVHKEKSLMENNHQVGINRPKRKPSETEPEEENPTKRITRKNYKTNV